MAVLIMASSSSGTDFAVQFKPGNSFKFPKRKFGKEKERPFRAEWCEKFPWLHYDVKNDAAFCYLCMKAAHESKFLTSSKREPAFISKGFTYWKEATSAFKKHQASDCHREANKAIVTLPKNTLGDIGELLSKEHQKEKVMNRKMLLTIFQNIRFLAHQGLPLRGSHEDMDSNFIQLLHLRSSDSPEITKWMNKKTNKYLSPCIQNECLQIMALQIIRKVSQNIRDSACFTIMADECTDTSNKE